jgi:hypothetical protein
VIGLTVRAARCDNHDVCADVADNLARATVAWPLRRGAVLTALVISLTACASDDSDGSPKATDKSSSPSSSEFVSERHSYHFELPPGWKVVEYDGTWTDFAEFSPGGEVPGEDVVSSPGSSGFLVSNSMAIPQGTSPEEWLAELDRLVSSGPTNTCRVTTGNDVVAGEQASITQHRCADMVYIGRSFTHTDRGYYFTMGFPPGDKTTKATLEGVVASIGFADQ